MIYYTFNRIGIKSEAKQLLQNNSLWFKAFFTIFPVLIFANFSSQFQIYRYIYLIHKYGKNFFLQNLPKTSTIYLANLLYALTFLSIPFFISISGYFLNILRQKNPNFTSLYKETFKNFGNYFTISIISGIIIFASSMVFIIPGIIASIILSQINYIIHDNPDLTPTQVMKMSQLMTKGYKWQLLEMYVSFIGWYLLIPLTFGIISIYIYPYFEITKAMYYENLKKLAIENGVIAAEAFIPATEVKHMGNLNN